jgi:hypothetical protein
MHFIIKLIHDHVLEVLYWLTEDQVAEIFMKTLTEVNGTLITTLECGQMLLLETKL